MPRNPAVDTLYGWLRYVSLGNTATQEVGIITCILCWRRLVSQPREITRHTAYSYASAWSGSYSWHPGDSDVSAEWRSVGDNSKRTFKNSAD